MRDATKEALFKALELSQAIQAYFDMGNTEMAHRTSMVFCNIMVTILVEELVEGAQEIMDEFDQATRPTKEGDLLQ